MLNEHSLIHYPSSRVLLRPSWSRPSPLPPSICYPAPKISCPLTSRQRKRTYRLLLDQLRLAHKAQIKQPRMIPRPRIREIQRNFPHVIKLQQPHRVLDTPPRSILPLKQFEFLLWSRGSDLIEGDSVRSIRVDFRQAWSGG